MKLYLQILISCLFLSCSNNLNKPKLELASDYFEAQKKFDTLSLELLLADDVEIYYGKSNSVENKKSIIKAAGFSYGLNTKNKLINIAQIDLNKVRLTISESDDLTKHLRLDNVVYNYLYEFKKNQIQKITIDTLDNPDFNYRQKEIEFNQGLNDLMKWVYKNHNGKARLIDEFDYDYKAGKILSELIGVKEKI